MNSLLFFGSDGIIPISYHHLAIYNISKDKYFTKYLSLLTGLYYVLINSCSLLKMRFLTVI